MNGSIHENIRELRREKQLTQEQLAEAMGVSGASVSKWENGQCAPDLSVLSALADYFEVSVDALLGHRLRTDRLKEMIEELKELAETRQYAGAEALAETILRNYPNSFEATEGCAEAYYNMYVVSEKKEGYDVYVKKSIELTKRLFVLGRGESEVARLERLTSLGNQYELIEDWEQAEKHYREGNVSGVNDRHLARCLMKQGRREKAAEAYSEFIMKEAFWQCGDVMSFGQLWKDMEQPEKACGLYEWAADGMEKLGFNTRLRQILYIEMASLYEQLGRMEQAGEVVRRAIRLADEPAEPADFIKLGTPLKILSNLPASTKEVLNMFMSLLGDELKSVAEEEMAK